MQTQQLYEKDFYAWVYHNIELIRTKKWDEIDTDLLIEELESMAKRDRHELISHLIILIAHLLKWQFQFKQLSGIWQEFDGKSWKRSINEQRKQIIRQLKMSPSLKSYFAVAIEEAFADAVDLAAKETQLSPETFPNVCPYSIEQLLNENFYPQQE
ncbi:DUF29 domain-containing protein [Candidatus Albibeggiatoa sp. nov. BB20]|uniref:DUF29 domain-containing protein n=1 Tax=Candidatus Albibeggiatoa sp. nov. BB20 TaxID=3162723 RepID=UPI00336541F5